MGKRVRKARKLTVRNPEGYIRTSTGKPFWPAEPRAEEVNIVDIAKGLSQQCRWTGQTKKFYSIAQHSIRVMKAVRKNVVTYMGVTDRYGELWALLHDASEAYIADVSRPVKHLPQMVQYRRVEERLEKCIFSAFDLVGNRPGIVKWADDEVLAQESKELMAGESRLNASGFIPKERPKSPRRAYLEFLYHFFSIQGAIQGKKGLSLYAYAIKEVFVRR